MSITTATDLDRFMHAIRTQLPPPDEWTPLATYPGSLAEAIIDAIWSERVRYGNIREIVDRYRNFRRWQGANADFDGAPELSASFSIGIDAWMQQIGNHQRAYSRDDAPYKAELVYEASEIAISSRVLTASDLHDGYFRNTPEFNHFHAAWLRLPSQHSGLTWERLLLVGGIQTVPLDLWLQEFTSKALGEDVGDQDALRLIERAAHVIHTTPLRLRNAIWQFQTKHDRSSGHGPHGAHRHEPGIPANEAMEK
ncbi:MAG: hypothetical protein LBH68_00975 [Bifidobacteriaceae bacterium]|jgi:hypothetical protein|nr:hypothetical protein [Bifidobacteriaceae bacterium]